MVHALGRWIIRSTATAAFLVAVFAALVLIGGLIGGVPPV